MDKLICYCFNYTKGDILDDLHKNGMSTIMERIKTEKKKGACQCKTKNPKGVWCLGDVRRVVEEAQKTQQQTLWFLIPGINRKFFQINDTAIVSPILVWPEL